MTEVDEDVDVLPVVEAIVIDGPTASAIAPFVVPLGRDLLIDPGWDIVADAHFWPVLAGFRGLLAWHIGYFGHSEDVVGFRREECELVERSDLVETICC